LCCSENKNIRTANSKEDAFVQGSENKIVQVSAKNEQSGTVNKISENEQIDTKITKNDSETPQRSTTDVVKSATADTVKSEHKNVVSFISSCLSSNSGFIWFSDVLVMLSNFFLMSSFIKVPVTFLC
jgi:hypothetical protein